MWGFWTAIAVVLTAASLLNHPGIGILVPIWYLVLQSVIFAVSLKEGYGKEIYPDQVRVAILAVVIFVVWVLVPGIPAWLAAVAMIACDIYVSRFQVISSWQEPWRESTRGWVISAPGAAAGFYGLSTHAVAAVAYPFYLAAFIVLVATVQLVSPNKRPREARTTYIKEAGVAA